VHTALQLAPLLAAEKSKLPFYIAGGALVAWALILSMAIGMRRPSFPATIGQQRAIVAVSAVLVLAAVASAVATSGGSAGGGEAKAAAPAATTESTASSPPTTESTTTPTRTQSTPSTATKPKATTGTPAPPSSPAAGAATKLALAADPGGQLAFDAKTLKAKAGTVSIVLTNASPVEHDVTIAKGSKVLGNTPTFVGGSKTVTLKLQPGTYTFYCSVPGHKQAGMEGTLTVAP
jgi:plastocyanin